MLTMSEKRLRLSTGISAGFPVIDEDFFGPGRREPADVVVLADQPHQRIGFDHRDFAGRGDRNAVLESRVGESVALEQDERARADIDQVDARFARSSTRPGRLSAIGLPSAPFGTVRATMSKPCCLAVARSLSTDWTALISLVL
jgi:hypothetical protein